MRALGQNSHLSAFVLVLSGLYLMGCAQTAQVDEKSELPSVQNLKQHEDDHEHHENEFLVLDPPPGYLTSIPSLGFSIVDVVRLDAMQSTLYHLKIDSGHHPFQVRHLHDKFHPNVIADVNHHFGLHARYRKLTDYFSRRAANWGTPKSGCGQGIRMGTVDGGLDTKHPAFKGRNVTYRSFHRKGQKISSIAHGTAVASVLVGGPTWGNMLPNAHLSATNVFQKNKKGRSRASAKGIFLAVNWLLKQRLKVINFSIGGSANRLVKRAIERAHKRGIILIASAGNNGPLTRKKSYPAAFRHVIAIAASNRFDKTAKFSSAGDYVEFSAPGVKIYTAVPGGGRLMSGTSFASPIVAAFAAAAIKYKGIKNLDQMRAYLRKNTAAHGRKKWDKFSGWGFLHVNPPC